MGLTKEQKEVLNYIWEKYYGDEPIIQQSAELPKKKRKRKGKASNEQSK